VPLFWRLETEDGLVLHPYVLRAGAYVALPEITGSGVAPAPWGDVALDLTVLQQ
jgi:hypothetical protein